MTSRRDFLQRASFALLPVVVAGQSRQDSAHAPGKSTGTAGDTLANSVGRPSAPLGPFDNDPGVIAIERKLRCSCGCTLDVYTCRTTDFSCTFSPRMHGIVVAKVQQGATAQQIMDWFVAQPESEFGGQKVLMAPPARGFDLMGYLVPGVTVVAFGLVLAAWLVRRRAATELPQEPAGGPLAPGAEELDRLRRALDDVES
jgi:cytochrome c-type biogenesis protein CcmH